MERARREIVVVYTQCVLGNERLLKFVRERLVSVPKAALVPTYRTIYV